MFKCWLCSTQLTPKEKGSNFTMGQDGVPLLAMQNGQAKDHLGRLGATNSHSIALERYSRRCREWMRHEWGAVEEQPHAQAGTIASSIETMQGMVQQERMFPAHLAYTCAWLKESENEYSEHCIMNRMCVAHVRKRIGVP